MTAPNGGGTARWQLWVSFSGISVVLIGALMSLYFQVTTAYTTANALQARLDRLAAQVAEDRLEIGQLKSAQIESYTQLRASIDDQNKGLAWQLRIDAVLWEQSFHGNSHLPIDNAYYPNIANGQSR